VYGLKEKWPPCTLLLCICLKYVTCQENGTLKADFSNILFLKKEVSRGGVESEPGSSRLTFQIFFGGQCLYLFDTQTIHIMSMKHNSIDMISLKT
jgi:hypothetical protein